MFKKLDKMKKIVSVFCITFFIIMQNSVIFANEYELDKTPSINSRHAVVYDRTSRKSIIWKKRKRKMQNGFNNKNHDAV